MEDKKKALRGKPFAKKAATVEPEIKTVRLDFNIEDIHAAPTEQKNPGAGAGVGNNGNDIDIPKTDTPATPGNEPPVEDAEFFDDPEAGIEGGKKTVQRTDPADTGRTIAYMYNLAAGTGLPLAYRFKLFNNKEWRQANLLALKKERKPETAFTEDELELIDRLEYYEILKTKCALPGEDAKMFEENLSRMAEKYNWSLGPEIVVASIIGKHLTPHATALLA